MDSVKVVLSRRWRGRIDRGWARYAEVWFIVFVTGALIFLMANLPEATVYSWPDTYYGITKSHGHNRFQVYDVVRREYRELIFCHDYVPKLFPGMVIGKLVVVENSGCQALNGSNLYFKLVRTDKADPMNQDWARRYGYLTYDDVDGQVLARNCHNNADDTDVICDGGAANFIQEEADANRTGQVDQRN